MESDPYKELLTRYPFLSYSRKLIEYFAIIGYEEGQITELCLEKKITPLKYAPTIISSVTSRDNEHENWSHSIILNQLYPVNPSMRFNDKEASHRIFCISFDSANGENKMMIMCYAYLFHELQKGLFFPKAFCIISQYPFFNTFKTLCASLHQYYLEYPTFPIEYIVSSIVNYYPSPVTHSLEYKFCEKTPPIRIPQLSGYPYVDFNLAPLFTHLPLPLVIEIYLFTIIECNVIFFSENEEILNVIMYVFSILNFPCNDSNYFWHIVSIPKESFLNASANAQFTSKLYSTISGVYGSYEDIVKEIKNTKEENSFIAVDLDNKKLVFHQNKKQKKNLYDKKIKQILGLVEKIAKDRGIASSNLKKKVALLMTSITSVLDKWAFIKDEGSFFKFEETINQRNRGIQLAFYQFYLNFLVDFYKENQLKLESEAQRPEMIKKKNTFSASTMSVELNLNEKKELSKNNEDLFNDEFKSTFKYTFFFYNFIQVFKCQDTYRIPLIFSEEFLTHYDKDLEKEKDKKKEKNRKKTTYFDIIDFFYRVDRENYKKIDWRELVPQISTDKLFYNSYQHEVQCEIKKRLPIHFNTKTVLNFIRYCRNLPKDKLEAIFPFHFIVSLQPIEVVTSESIVGVTEEIYFLINKITPTEILLSSCIYLLGIIIASNKTRLDILNFSKEILKKILYFKRKYISILLKYMDLIRRSIIKNKESNEIKDDINNLVFYYYPLFNSFRNAKMIPNEELMSLLSIFVPLVEGMGTEMPVETVKNEEKVSIIEKPNNETPTEESPIVEGTSLDKVIEKSPDLNQKDRLSIELSPEAIGKEPGLLAKEPLTEKEEDDAEDSEGFDSNNLIKIKGYKGKPLDKVIDANGTFTIQLNKDSNKSKQIQSDKEKQALFEEVEKVQAESFIETKNKEEFMFILHFEWKEFTSKTYSPLKMLRKCHFISSKILKGRLLTEGDKQILNDLLLNFLFYTKHLGFNSAQIQTFEKDISDLLVVNNYPNDH